MRYDITPPTTTPARTPQVVIHDFSEARPGPPGSSGQSGPVEQFGHRQGTANPLQVRCVTLTKGEHPDSSPAQGPAHVGAGRRHRRTSHRRSSAHRKRSPGGRRSKMSTRNSDKVRNPAQRERGLRDLTTPRMIAFYFLLTYACTWWVV